MRAASFLKRRKQNVAAEQKVVEYGNHGQKRVREGEREYAVGEKRGVDPREPFDFDREDKEKQDLYIGIIGGEGEKHGQIDIFRHTVRIRAFARKEIHGKGIHDREEHPRKEVKAEFRPAPFPFHDGSDEIIKIQEQQRQHTA